MKKMFLNVFTLLILPFSLVAQNGRYSIKGTIADEQAEPLVSATVVVRQNGQLITGAITDTAGYYAVSGLSGGDYELNVSFLGFETHVQSLSVSANQSLDTIVLKDMSTAIGEVVVTGQRRRFSMSGSSITVPIENTALSYETDVMDILRKIPGMTLSQGELTSFAGEKPDIYINGRKIRSVGEVRQLSVKDIKTIVLDTSPGSKYDASAGAVLLITTRSKLDGWSMQLDGELKRNHRTGNSEAIKINYNRSALNVFASFGYDDSRRKSVQLMQAEIYTPDTLWKQRSSVTSERHIYKEYAFSLGADYTFGDAHSGGVKYDGVSEAVYDRSPYESDIHAGNSPFAALKGEMATENDDFEHHVNGWYKGKLSPKTELDVYADYVQSNKRRDQQSREISSEYGTEDVASDNISNYFVYAVSSRLNRAFGDMHLLTLGYDWSLVDGRSSLTYRGGVAGDSETGSAESKLAGYVTYSYKNRPFSLEAGLRYEKVHYTYDDLFDRSNSMDRNYVNLFPGISISHAKNELNQSLSYRITTVRPNFNMLNNYSTYVNRFMYQTGNPKLRPQLSHRMQYSASYRFVWLSLGYIYNNNYIGSFFHNQGNNASTLIYSWQNFDRQQQLNATVSVHHRTGFYEPSLTGMFRKNIQQVDVLDQKVTVDRPLFIFRMNNALYLPLDIFLNIEYQYQSAGSVQIYTFKPVHTFNMNFSKSFCKNALQVNVQFNDIFRRDISIYEGKYDNIGFSQREDQDRRSAALHIVYRFNNFSKKNRGQSAAGDEINRLH
ncbi:MAG: outer membrane beta-barrel protein [Tannerella sp.]|nr:outer membrane beta-barrel protein [Tannerella sp.]